MKNIFSNINAIPVRTWRWLKVNDTDFSKETIDIKPYTVNPIPDKKNYCKENFSCLEISDIKDKQDYIKKINVKINEKDDVTNFVEKNYNSGYYIKIKKGFNVQRPIIFNFDFDDNNNVLMDNTFIELEENSSATIIFRYKSNDIVEAVSSNFTKIFLGKNSKLKFVKAQLLGKNSHNLDYTAVNIMDNGKLDIIISDLGSKESISNAYVDLTNEKSKCNLYSIYVGQNKDKLDYNYKVTHNDKNTFSKILANGILMDKSKKVFRGTIDFKSGTAGSIGSEEEHTTLLSDKVTNISVPILLAGEFDIEGSHAANTNKLDENVLFYLMSRGYSLDTARKVMVEAAINPVVKKIEVDNIQNEILDFVRRSLDNVR